ncbi:MAG TPA: GldG family protein [Candidatus Acidoferrales bacterium]|nr:GldG family protein [Candidatus Acidoferrales bacterium]
MQKKSLETILYSSAGILVMLAIVVAVNVITGVKPLRVDLTQEKAYTLSDGTRAVLKKLDTPVRIRFYCTQSENATPETVFLKSYAREVGDLLQEYKQVAGKNLIIEKYDPQPDSDAEDSARLDGLEPQAISGEDRFYLGLSVSLADQSVALPFLDPSRERQLEYDITRAISQVLTPEKPVVGVMSALPVFGEAGNPMMMQMGQQGGTPAWTIIDQLKQDYTVKRVEMTADKIDDDINVLLVIHPKDISDQAQYAIDQFVLRGGKLIAFLDPQSVLSSRQQNPMSGEMGGASSSLDKLLKAWGLQFDTGKVVADLNYKMQLRGRDGQPEEAPAFLALTGDGVNTNDVTTSQIDNVWLPLCGAFTGEPAAGLKETVLLQSSKNSELVDGMMANMGGASILNGFKPSGVNYKLAVRLTGKFKTAFPEGKPEEKAEGTNQVAKATDNSLKESKVASSVVLFGDSDLLADDFSLRKMDGPFGAMVSEMNQNLDLAQNVIEQMAGDSNLIGVRSRATMSRPFTLIKKMEADAEAQGQAKIDELQQSLQETQQRLSELQQQKQDKDQRFILSPEQKAELENFRKKQAAVSKALKQAQKDLRKEVVSTENRLTWLNILAMPLGVTAAGIGIAVIKRKRTSAK